MVLAVQAAIGVISVVVRRSAKAESWQRGDFTAVAPCCPYSPVDVATRLWLGRHSADSGRGLSMEQNSPYEDEEDGLEREEWNPAQVVNEKADDERPLKRLERFLSARVPAIFNARVVKICDFAYSAISRLLIPLGYTQICLGIITGSGIFVGFPDPLECGRELTDHQMGSTVFNGLAHFIKGSIFIFYGIFTLSRWLGSFADLGWAWNQPSKRFTSEEAVSSMIIFIYGCANVFLEHLAGWGGAWSHGDLQHVSIAFMFFGGGLLGMLFESRRIRSFLSNASSPEETTPGLSFNPMPSIVIFLLGILMSQHHQPSHLSTVIHTQWGMLLAAAAVFRLLTYMMFFRAPPQGLQPSRPPTEVVAAFCLVAGGLVFMISNKDTVAYLDVLGVDAMFSLTVTVGFTALVLSWVTVVVAVKGWAGRKEVRREAGRV